MGMRSRRTRLVFFALLLATFSANYIFWAVGATTNISQQKIFSRLPGLAWLTLVSQYTRVYDSPYFFSTRNVVTLTYDDGRKADENIVKTAYGNPLDEIIFYHVWYWRNPQDQTAAAQKERLLRLRFCRPGVKSLEWNIYYMENSRSLNLGGATC
jgi:hypothetical protein